ncbi:hypothetical protein AAFF_G00033600 [Aldrovandia affinis]|uniref:Uncharacterized protein n=1 Tax=Aldrovandia affinis TaxID=143900 RepID=A0AAD7S3S6_9TELE|nr:hypothetical protein AAFF_G00033600 [Aldrovandia affinis]
MSNGEGKMCGFQEVNPNASTEPLPESESADENHDDGEVSLADLFPMDLEGVPVSASLAGKFGTTQLEDPNLASALQQVTVVDGKPLEGIN